ncbi:hypothetical protein FQN49_001863 [Arthroderma sp. PD_2]|nr:hypothetical protein FQN49_001863 [Arthroderma sp. PD_2]
MSAPLKRPSEDEDFQEEYWEDSQALAEESDGEESSQQPGTQITDSPTEEMTEVPITESAASTTTEATAPARRPKKPRRGKNSPEPNYSEMVQGQMSTTNRTGQACDRCKGRKMKCDSNSTGCANCIAGNLPCTQTDPITRVSYTRGELERLRSDNETLVAENQRLRAENASLREYIHSLLTSARGQPLEGGNAQSSGTGMGTQSRYVSYEALQAAQRRARAQAEALRAAEEAGQSFPIIYPQNSGQSAVPGMPTMPDQTQFGPMPGTTQFPGYHPSMGQNPYAGRNPVSTPQQNNQGAYQHGSQQQGGQQGGSQGHPHGQEQEQGELQQPSGAQGSNSGASQDPPGTFNYFPGI